MIFFFSSEAGQETQLFVFVCFKKNPALEQKAEYYQMLDLIVR